MCESTIKRQMFKTIIFLFLRQAHMWEQMSTATNTTTTPPTSGAETGKPARKHATMCNEFGRWVIYNPKHGVDYDASMVPATWFGWLHYKTDKTPVEKVAIL